jgi:hypothetical protein
LENENGLPPTDKFKLELSVPELCSPELASLILKEVTVPPASVVNDRENTTPFRFKKI